MAETDGRYSIDRRSALKLLGGMGVVGSGSLAGCTGAPSTPDDDGGSGGSGGNGESTEAGDGNDGSDSADKETWRFVTSTEGSGSSTIGPAYSVLFERHSQELGISPQNSKGFVHNMRLLDQNQAELGFAHNIVFFWLYNEEGPFAEAPVDVRPVQGLPTIQNLNHHFITRRDVGVETVTDLAGHTVSLGPPGGAVPEIAERVLRGAGVWEEVNGKRMSFTEGVSAMRAGEVDAFFTGIINNRTNSATLELWNTEDIEFVVMSDETVDSFLEKYPFFSVTELQTDHPVWPDAIDTQYDAVTLPQLNSTSAIHPDLSEDRVYHAIKTLHENQEELAELNKLLWGLGFGEVDLDGETFERWGLTGQLTSVPVHQGAAKYLKEIGHWNDDYDIAE